MRTLLSARSLTRAIPFGVAALLVSAVAPAQTLPPATTVAAQMKVGWNIGNTLEAMCGETVWGNPPVNQQLISAVKAAGFNTIRIPVAWDCHANQSTLVIDPAWLARVKEVVDYAYGQGMYVIFNIHWDGGWLEEHPVFSQQEAVNRKQAAYWTQLANYFKSYDERLMFAGTNEVHADYGEPTPEHITVQQSYNQTFVNAVRATGGNNASRTLVVQTYNTNMWHGLHYFTPPTDTIANRQIVEVHHYDPYDYTLNPSGSCLYWGAPYPPQGACAWAQEAYVDDLLNQVRAKWVANGVPVIIGEWGVGMRPNLDVASRQYYYRYLNQAATRNGIKTFVWDIGVPPTQSGGNALFNRTNGAIVDQGALDAIMQGVVGGGTPTPTARARATATATATVPRATATATATSGGGSTAFNRARFFPRGGFASRMLNGSFQGSNTSSTSGYVTLGTITTTPPDNAWSELNFSNGTTYRWVRYLSPNGGFGNVAELEFYGGTTRLTGTGFGTAGSWNNSGNTFDKALDGNTSTFFDAPTADGHYIGIDRGGAATATATATTRATATATATPRPTATSTAAATATATATTAARPTATATASGAACSPVTATITAPFTFDGAGTLCWRSNNLGAYVNSWNTTRLTINGVDFTNLYVASSSYPAKLADGYWYVSFSGPYAWSHFETK